MTAAGWVRLAAMLLAALWLGRRYSGGRRSFKRWEAALLGLLAVLAIAQFLAEAITAASAATPAVAVLAGLAPTVFGFATVAIVLETAGLAIYAYRAASRKAEPWSPATVMVVGLAALLLWGESAFTAAGAVAAASESGEIAMSPTLSVPRSTAGIRNPVSNDAASIQRGKLVYQANCQICHGISGDGRGPASANMRIKPASFLNPQHYLSPSMDGPHFYVIQHGDGQPDGMPAWQGKLTDQQTWDVLNYVKSLSATKG